MTKTKVLERKNLQIAHNLELLGYITTKKLRKSYDIYDFSNSFISKYKAYKDFKLLEKELSNSEILTKDKKIIQLT